MYVTVRDRLRDMPPPVLRAAGFWQKQRFRGRRGGERDGRVRAMEEEEEVEEEEEGRGFGCGTDAWPCGDGRVVSSLIGFGL